MARKMTTDEVVRLGRTVAEREGWPWLEPIEVSKHRRWWIVGRATWHLVSNANYRSQQVHVHVDDKTGEVRTCYVP